MFLLWLRQLPPCRDRTPASVPPPTKDRSSPTNTPILPPSSFLLPSFAWFYIFFSASQVLLWALSWCSAALLCLKVYSWCIHFHLLLHHLVLSAIFFFFFNYWLVGLQMSSFWIKHSWLFRPIILFSLSFRLYWCYKKKKNKTEYILWLSSGLL